MITHPIIPKWMLFSILSASIIGFLDAVYLTAKHYSGTLLTCSLFTGCEEVTTSIYATFFGIPVALGGSFFYFIVLVFTLIFINMKSGVLLRLLICILPVGFLASIWFVYLQLFVLKAICQYCMVSAITSTVLFAFWLFFMVKYRKQETKTI
jgi:uncharacterized membrane protein